MGVLERFGGVHGGKFGKRRQYQFRLVELTCGALGTNQNSAPHITRRERQREAHIGLFGGKKKVSEQEIRQPHHNHLTSINAEIDRCNDGNVLVARELSDALRAKIRWGILTP